jgi:hypothetical protein
MEITLLYLLFIGPLIGVFWGLATLIGLCVARGVPFVPLTGKQLRNITEHVRIPSDARVADLGSGDGRVLRLFERNYSIVSPAGYEINLWACWKSKVINKFKGSTAKIYYKNFFKEDLSGYNVVFCYLFPNCMNKLKDKFENELSPGSKVISYAFEIKDWKEPEVIYCDKNNHNVSRIFIYTI